MKSQYVSRHTRREVLRGAAASGAGLAALSLLGCRQEGTPATAPAAGTVQPKRGGAITRSRGNLTDAYSGGFDPHVLTGAYGPLMGLFYQNLVKYHNVTLDLSPELAEKWEQPSQTEYLFSLNPAAKWQNKPPANGRALTASDVVFSLNRFRSDDARFINRSLLSSVDKIEAVNTSTVRITTRSPDVTLLMNLADVQMAILNPEVAEKAGKFATVDTAVGTGAFILQSSDDTVAHLVRNPDYWKPGLPYLDSVRLLNQLDPQARFAAFLAGQFDIVQVPGQEAKKFFAEQSQKYWMDWAKEVATYTVWPNTRRKPFDDARVTRALRLLVDHNEAITGWADVWHGRGSLVGSGHFPSMLEQWDFSEEEYRAARGPAFLEWKQPKDEAAREALALLSAAGFSRETPLKFELSQSTGVQSQSATQILQQQFLRLAQGVVQPEIKIYDNVVLLGLMARGEWDLAGPTARGGYIEPDQVLQQVYRSTGGQNFGKWSDPKADEMIDRQRTIFDAAQRKALIKEILTYLMLNAPYTGFTSPSYLNVTQPKLRDFTPEHVSRFRGDQYERIWLDV
jgi:ABC-type transport system substrate-binding protein